MDCHGVVSKRYLSHNTNIFSSFAHSNILWKMLRIFCWDFATSLPVPEHWSKMDSVRLTRRWVSRLRLVIHYSPRVSPYWKTNDLRSAELVLRTSPKLLRGHWAGWRKLLCESTTLLSSNHPCSESIFSSSFSRSKSPRPNALVPLYFEMFTVMKHHHLCRPFPQTIGLVNEIFITLFFCSCPEEWLMCFKKPSCVRLSF